MKFARIIFCGTLCVIRRGTGASLGAKLGAFAALSLILLAPPYVAAQAVSAVDDTATSPSDVAADTSADFPSDFAADWEPSDQVLEIPQACTPDGPILTCNAAGGQASVDPSSSTDVSDDSTDGGDADSSQASATTATDPASATNTDEASNDPTLGNLQDYENQGIVETPISPMYTVPAETTASEPIAPAYIAPVPIIVPPPAPVVYAPVYIPNRYPRSFEPPRMLMPRASRGMPFRGFSRGFGRR